MGTVDGLSREIVVRAWDKNKCKMTFWGDENPRQSTYSNGEIMDFFEDGDIMLYTGIKDIKGIKIFEGDICKQIDPYNQNFDIEFGVDLLYQMHSLMVWDSENKLEVIGNIFENPELLDKPTDDVISG